MKLRVTLFAACLAAAPAFAGVQSFVSIKGTDTGTCASAAAPCRTFAYAHSQTGAGGEILAFDAGDYGPVTITKSLSITGAVEGAGIRGGGNAITINAGAAGVVDLTGLTFDGLGTALNGLRVNSAGVVTVKKCVFRNYTDSGVKLFAESTKILIEDISVANVTFGVDCGGACAINRVSVNNASGTGIGVDGSAAVSESTITGSHRGIHGLIGLNRSVVTGNNIGLTTVVRSAGDNFVRDNGTNFSSAPDVVGKQ